MPEYQVYNKKKKAWIKFSTGKFKPGNVKQKEPQKKFKGVPVKKK